MKIFLTLALCVVIGNVGHSQESTDSKPAELEVIKASVGVWDAEIEVWPGGLDSPSIKFKGVETNRAYGEHWISSDFDSTVGGQTMKIHSIIGYDPGKKKLVGTVIDHGPYSASMTGEYDKKNKSVQWKTVAKDANGKPIIQRTVLTQKTENERVLVLSVPGEKKDEFKKFMEIKFVKRKKQSSASKE